MSIDLHSVDAYDFFLPDYLIAKKPAVTRDESRLLVLHRSTGKIEHRTFLDLIEYLDSDDLLVANNTKVLKARLTGYRLLPPEHLKRDHHAPIPKYVNEGEVPDPEANERGETTGEILRREGEEKIGGKVEMLLLEKIADRTWEGAFQSAGRQIPGFRFFVEEIATGGDALDSSDSRNFKKVSPSDGSRTSSLRTSSVVSMDRARRIEGEIIRGSTESKAGTVIVRFNEDPVDAGVGVLPLPHYIGRDEITSEDEERYQTVFAKKLGSAAAPTAGLHFTPRVMAALREKKISWEEVTLHVGLGTFRPVKVDRITDHAMHEERYIIPDTVADKILSHRARGGRITAVGTTTVRSLESAYVEADIGLGSGDEGGGSGAGDSSAGMGSSSSGISGGINGSISGVVGERGGGRHGAGERTGKIQVTKVPGSVELRRELESTLPDFLSAPSFLSGEQRTDIFFYPGGRPFRVVDRLLTNFHLPKSTLLMLVSAFAGRDLVLAAYEEAVREKYRFFSYGDAMLIL